MNRKMKILLIILTFVFLMMTSCDIHNDQNETSTTEEETFAFGIEKGMTRDEAVAILGDNYTDIGSGLAIYEWILEEKSQRVLVWFHNDENYQMVVQSMKIESMEKETE